eukprot:5468922-Alexandrium_andersonii.AAC.1
MSASLVGSEMCIRDRASGCQRFLQFPPLARGAAAPRTPAAPRRRQLGPVSYTHLTLPTICSV